MRDFLIFLVVLTIIFFAVGETRGWYLGVPGQTPMFVYKKDYVAQTTLRTINVTSLPVNLRGTVRRGTVKVEIIFEDRGSFQDNTEGQLRGRVVLFEQEYRTGQRVVINEAFEGGVGFYLIRLTFEDANGTFRLTVPKSSAL
jgi:hypothetical protein